MLWIEQTFCDAWQCLRWWRQKFISGGTARPLVFLY